MSEKDLFGKYYEEAEKYLSKMTLEQKIGQMFFFKYSNLAKDQIQNKNIGGFVLYAKDFNREEKLIIEEMQSLQDLSMKTIKLPLGLAVDEEGGYVNRVSLYHRKEGKFPSPQEIYKNSGIQGILSIEQEKRKLLRNFHLNINLAPVADISNNPSNFIYKRTLGKSANETANYVSEEVKAYVEDNFSCCAKHFPGYGGNLDTHGEISIDSRNYENFINENNGDLLPFKKAIENKIPMILFSHNIVKCKDEIYPVSVSKTWHDILRSDLNYSGIIITDDLSMGAVSKSVDESEVAILAIKAGNDILITENTNYLDYAIEAANEGDISEDLIDNACRRIIAWKLKYFLNFQPTHD